MLRWQIATAASVGAAVVMTALALVLETDRIERDVEGRATASLQGELTSWAAVSVTGRDVTLTGAATDPDVLSMAAVRLDRLAGVRSVDASRATLIPEQRPYVVTLTRGGRTVLVGGVAPSDPERKRMLARVSATLPDLGTADALSLARGMPDRQFLEALHALTPAAGDLANGRVMLRDRVATIDGEAASNEAYDRLRTMAPDLPEGYALTPPTVVRPVASPFVMTAILVDGRVSLSGYAPEPEARAELVAMAEGDRGLEVRESIDLASGAPDGFAAAAAAAIDFIDLFASARIEVVDSRISIGGVAASPEAYRTLTSHVGAFQPSGFTVETSIDLPVVKPFMLTATRSGDKVAVSGFAPTPAVAEDIRRAADAVAGPDGAVVETTLANGAAPDFAAAAVFAVRLLEHVSDGSVVIADTRITLTGLALSSGNLLEIEASIALEAPETFTVETAVQPPVVSPYTWSLERTADSVVLSGHVPSEAVRVAVRDAADDAIGDLAVTDRTALAAGLPDGIDLAAVASFSAAEIALLDEGRVELSDRTLSIRGKTADALAGRSAIDAFETQLPAGLEKGAVEIDAPAPFQFRIEREPGALIVEGGIADETARSRIVDAASRFFGRAGMELVLVPTSGLPAGAEAAVIEGLRAASLLRSGTIVISDTEVEIAGTALTEAAVERIDTDIVAAMPGDFRTRASIAAPPPPDRLDTATCQERLDETLELVRVRFAPGEAGLSADSEGAMAEIAAAALACPDSRLVVEVGSDSDTPPALAGERALSIAAALSEAGVPADAVTGRAGTREGALAITAEPPTPVTPPDEAPDPAPAEAPEPEPVEAPAPAPPATPAPAAPARPDVDPAAPVAPPSTPPAGLAPFIDLTPPVDLDLPVVPDLNQSDDPMPNPAPPPAN